MKSVSQTKSCPWQMMSEVSNRGKMKACDISQDNLSFLSVSKYFPHQFPYISCFMLLHAKECYCFCTWLPKLVRATDLLVCWIVPFLKNMPSTLPRWWPLMTSAFQVDSYGKQSLQIHTYLSGHRVKWDASAIRGITAKILLELNAGTANITETRLSFYLKINPIFITLNTKLV